MTTVGYSQVIKLKAYKRTFVNKDGSQEESTVNTLLVLNMDKDEITIYNPKPIHFNIISYLDPKGATANGKMIAVDDNDNRLVIYIKYYDYPESYIIFDYNIVGGGMITYAMKSVE